MNYLFLALVFFLLTVGLGGVAMHLVLVSSANSGVQKEDDKGSAKMIYGAICGFVAGISLIMTVVYLFLVHQQVAQTIDLDPSSGKNQVAFGLVCVSYLLGVICGVLSEWKVNATTQKVLRIVTGVLAGISVIATVFLQYRFQSLKSNLEMAQTSLNVQYPRFASSFSGVSEEEEKRVVPTG